MTPAQSAVSIRLRRLIAGHGTSSDVDAVLADLRFDHDCPPTVADIAHFAAHRHDRDKGLVFDGSVRLVAELERYFSHPKKEFNAKSAYDVQNVLAALRIHVLSKKLIRSEEAKNFGNIQDELAKFALCAMHGCTLYKKDTKSNSKSKRTKVGVLSLRSGFADTLEMSCNIDRNVDGKAITFNFCIFGTDLPNAVAEGQLFADLVDPQKATDITATIEVLRNGKLAYLA